MSDRVGGCGGGGPNLNGQLENSLRLRELQGNVRAAPRPGGIGESFRSTSRYPANASPLLDGLPSRHDESSLNLEQFEAPSSAVQRLQMIVGHIIAQDLAPPAGADQTPPGLPSADSQPAEAQEQRAAATRRVRFRSPDEGDSSAAGHVNVPQDSDTTSAVEYEMRRAPSPTSPMFGPVEMNIPYAEFHAVEGMADYPTSAPTFANTTETSRSNDFIVASSVEAENAAATDVVDKQDFELLMQPDIKEITVEQLEAELKGILAGLTMVDEKANKIYAEYLDEGSREKGATLTNEQLQAMYALFETRLKEIYDYLLASSHPVATEEMNNRPLENGVIEMLSRGIVPIIEAYEKMICSPNFEREHYERYQYRCHEITTALIEEIPRFHTELSGILAFLHESPLKVAHAESHNDSLALDEGFSSAWDDKVLNAIRWRAVHVILRDGRLGGGQMKEIDWSRLRSEHELLGTIFTETFSKLRDYLSSDEHFQALFDKFLDEVAEPGAMNSKLDS